MKKNQLSSDTTTFKAIRTLILIFRAKIDYFYQYPVDNIHQT